MDSSDLESTLGVLLPPTVYVKVVIQKSGKRVLISRRITEGVYAVQARSFLQDWEPFAEDGEDSEVNQIAIPNLVESIMELAEKGMEVVGFVLDEDPGLYAVA